MSRIIERFKADFHQELVRCAWSVSREKSDVWLIDFVGGEYGSKDFDWSPAAARELAQSYMQEFGE